MSKDQLAEVLRGVLVTPRCPVIPNVNPEIDLTSIDSEFPMEPLDGVSLETYLETFKLDQKGAHSSYVLNTSLLNLYGPNPLGYLPPSTLCSYEDIGVRS
jgi:hypothetical protein